MKRLIKTTIAAAATFIVAAAFGGAGDRCR